MQQMFSNIISGRQPLQLSVRLDNSSAPVSAAILVHKMSRWVYTGAELWKEWILGNFDTKCISIEQFRCQM
ncbi:hypothetical protein [Parasitella parasitica]|uniref:Uncharacterized protein n=1 Tax=Parasitella parasitica TaxID=35722 RepID=A0A0B7N2Q6_9FUNG|nr:hypothetical protein [Parasitella parasitica]